MKKLFALLLSTILLLSLAACTTADDEPMVTEDADATEETMETIKVGLSISTLNNPFFVSLADGAQAAADAGNVELTIVDANDDVAKQINDIEDLVSKNVSVLIVNAVDSDAVASTVQTAMDDGIQVIAVDRAVNGVEVAAQIASDNVAGAKLATEYLVELVGENAQVIELQGVPGASATNDRGEGFHAIADTQLDVVASQTANFNRAEGLTVMENLLQANPDVKGVFAHNDEMALGAMEAIEASGKDIKVIGFDATDDALASIEAKEMSATVQQQPDLMGQTAVETAIKLANGEAIEASIPVEVKLVK